MGDHLAFVHGDCASSYLVGSFAMTAIIRSEGEVWKEQQAAKGKAMSEVYFSIDQTPEGGLQLSINSDGTGYRICGPKYDGRSKTLGRHKITPRDVEELRSYLRRSSSIPDSKTDAGGVSLLARARHFVADSGCDEDDMDVNLARVELLQEIDAALRSTPVRCDGEAVAWRVQIKGTGIWRYYDQEPPNYTNSICEPLYAAPPAPSGVREALEIEFEYTNWQGRKSLRQVRPISIRFGKNEWHPQPGWLMRAFDLDRGVEREFEMREMQFEESFLAAIALSQLPATNQSTGALSDLTATTRVKSHDVA